MRKKIKELLNKEEGFTLVELLAVLVILAIIVAIAIPAVGSVISNAEEDASEVEQQLIVDAARLYYTSEDSETVDDTVTVTELEANGYLEERANDPIQRGTVTRTEEDNGTYSYKFSSGEKN